MGFTRLYDIILQIYNLIVVEFGQHVINFLFYQVDLPGEYLDFTIIELVFGFGLATYLIIMVAKWIVGIVT